jgi:high affinity sulfate transporter 1
MAYLTNEWRVMFRPSSMVTDALAGIAVALVALPLSLAIANASGVAPEVGLVTAIVGGITVALFGGCRLQVSGPAAAMTFLVYEVATKYGHGGLIASTLMAGALQVVAGVFRLGRFMQFIPRPVVAGFLSGIGLTILCTQLSIILGYDVSHDEEGGAFSLLWQTVKQIRRTVPHALVTGLTAVVVMLGLPRLTRRLPTPLIAVLAATLLPIVLGWGDVRLLGALPRTFPLPTLPVIPFGYWNELVMVSLTIFLLASIESLLSASVVDSMRKETRVDNDQELVGQGLGNMASAFFGGIPVTGVIARSATNIQAGARTRLSAIIHALILLVSMLALAPLVGRIPLAALAGVLVAVALRMIEFHMLATLWRGSRPEAVVFIVTAGAILLTDLIDGVQIGMIATVLYFVYEMSNINLRTVPVAEPAAEGPSNGNGNGNGLACPHALVLDVEGPLFFASGFHLRNMVNRLSGYRCLIMDLRGVPFLDVTGAEILNEEAGTLHRRAVELLLVRPNAAVRERLRSLATSKLEAIQSCPIMDTMEDALSYAAKAVEAGGVCPECRESSRCLALERLMQARIPLAGATDGP